MNNRDDGIANQFAVLQPNGSYINKYNTFKWYDDKGQYHRTDGPVYDSNGVTYWYLNGTQYDFNHWLTLTPIPDEQKLLLRLQYD